MLEQLKYKNHLNEVFEFGKDGIFVDSNDLHDYEWSITTKNEKIAALTRKVSKRQLPVKISCSSEAAGIAARNRLFEVAEKDVLAMKHGQIICGDYYFRCFVTGSKKKSYQVSDRLMDVTLTLTTDYPFWVKETKTAFSTQAATFARNLDFPHDYPFDYHSLLQNQPVNNTGFAASNFRLIIYGPCVNPTINIAGHTYKVNCTVEEGEYLTIDSATKKIYVTGNTGATTNKFNDRNRESYIFEKIPSGSHTVAWDGSFGFDVIILEERSEPKWI